MDTPKKALLGFSVIEGLAKTLGGVFQKLIGTSLKALPISAGCLAYMIAECVKVVVSLTGRRLMTPGAPFFPSFPFVAYACLFGIVASLMTVGGIYTFLIGADLPTRTLLIVATPVAAMIIQPIFFPVKIEWSRQIPGLVIFLFAAFIMLGSPQDLSFDLWVWLTFVIMVLAALNGVITKKGTEAKEYVVKRLGEDAPEHSAQVWNFWTGVSAVIFSFAGFLALGATVDLTIAVETFIAFAVFLGLVVSVISLAKFLAFRGGGKLATVDFQSFVMNMSYLALATSFSALFNAFGVRGFEESVETHHLVGIALFAPAYVFLDKGTYSAVATRLGTWRTSH